LYVSEIFHCAHVLGALKGARVRAADLAHAALHLTHRVIFMALHPLDHPAFHVAQMIDPVPQQCRTEHGYVSTRHEQLDHVLGAVNPARSGQIRLYSTV